MRSGPSDKSIFLRFDKRHDLRSNQVANIRTMPTSCNEQIVRISESAKACGKRRIEIL